MYYLLILAGAAAAFGQVDPMRAGIEKQKAAIAVQRQAIRRQAATASVWMLPWNPAEPAAPPDCDPIPDVVASPLIESAAKAQQLEPKLLRALIEQESAFRPCAVSPKGAMGLMQLMPATVDQLAVRDPFDPKESIEAGAKYLKQMMDRYKGDLPEALGAYNAGPGAVDQAGGIPNIQETRGYVDAILRKLGLSSTAQPNSPKPTPIEN